VKACEGEGVRGCRVVMLLLPTWRNTAELFGTSVNHMIPVFWVAEPERD
jgi:hypothetical protein